jgi:hypothetical protein
MRSEKVKPKPVSAVAVVHCNYGNTDAMVVFYRSGNIDKEIACEGVGTCLKRIGSEKLQAPHNKCWLLLPFRTFVD